MGKKSTQILMIVVFGLIIILATYFGIQALYDNLMPTDAEIHSVAYYQLSHVEESAEFTNLVNRYNNAEMALFIGQIVLVVEGIIALLLVLVVALQQTERVEDRPQDPEPTFRRAYQGA